MFNILDEEFLRFKGYKVLHTPESDAYMNQNVLLYSPGATPFIVWASFLAAIPAVYISQAFDNWHLYHTRPPEDSHENPAEWSTERKKLEWLLASESVNHRKLFDSIFKELVGEEIKFEHPDSSTFTCKWLFYKPDSEDELRPYQAYVKDHRFSNEKEAEAAHEYDVETESNRLWTRLEAITLWLKSGCKSLFLGLGSRIIALMKGRDVTNPF